MSLNPFPNALFSLASCSYAITVLEMLTAFEIPNQNRRSPFLLTEKTRFINILFPKKKETQKMKRTFQPNNRKRKKNHGFLVRMRSKGGRHIIKNRRRKGRTRLAV